MTNVVTASAPGKVVLSGEYAVLDGAPAICMAVNRRARAVVADTGGDISAVTAHSSSTTVGRFRCTGTDLEWQAEQASFRVIDSVHRATGFARAGARLLNLDTTEFSNIATQQKLGIGSSAAITVALCAAVTKSADIAELTWLAQRAHASLQDGVGSGVDIASSVHGGLIEYRMGGAPVSTLRWPDGVSYRLIWTGVAASTRDKLLTLDARISKPSRELLLGASEDMAAAWKGGDAAQIIAGCRDYSERLRQFSSDHDLGIFDAGHDELCDAARAAGLSYKPCGAGGGDVGILLGPEDVDLDVFMSAQATAYSVLDCEMSSTGVRIDV